jgi:hypothetical protein
MTDSPAGAVPGRPLDNDEAGRASRPAPRVLRSDVARDYQSPLVGQPPLPLPAVTVTPQVRV